jgi:hypothetical protein
MTVEARASARNTINGLIAENMVPHDFMKGHIEDFDKPAGQRCPHQRHGKGCRVYEKRPFGCTFWGCRWLVEDDTADLSRPDHSHYVIDASPDYVTDNNDTPIPVIQIWVDPDYPDAHRDPALREYLKRRAAEGVYGLIRYNSRDGMFLVYDGKEFFEKNTGLNSLGREHTAMEIAEAVGEYKITLEKE